MKIFTDKGYIYQKHLSTGGEGEVHLIKSVDKQFVAKIFPILSQKSVDVLKTIQSLNISGVPKIHEIFNHKNKTIIIREYVEGTTLYAEIRKNEFLSFKRAKAITLKICEILSKLHRATPRPLIYRDLKPENIIITPEGDVNLIDFGIARYYNIESTRDTVLAGTKGYTAPEVMAGMQSDIRSDVYSAGLIFYEMLTGKNLLIPPFQIRPVRESNELLPEYLDTIIEKSTDLNQTNRYKTIEEFAKAIEHQVIKKKKSLSTKNVFIGVAVAAVLSLTVSGIWLLQGGFQRNQNADEIIPSASNELSDTIEKDSYLNTPEQIVAEENYELLLDLQFEDAEDFLWLDIIYDNEYHNAADKADYTQLVQNGVLDLDYEFCLKYNFGAGDFFHIRIKPGEAEQDGTVLLLCFVPKLSSEWSESSYEIKFDNKQVIFGEIRNDYGYYNQPSKGSPLLVNDYWMDVIVCLDEEGEVFRYLVFDAEKSSKVVYGGAKVFDSWKLCDYQISTDLYYEYWKGQLGETVPKSQIDFIRQGNGSIEKYLEDNIDGYYINKENIDEFLNSNIKFISEEHFTQHGY